MKTPNSSPPWSVLTLAAFVFASTAVLGQSSNAGPEITVKFGEDRTSGNTSMTFYDPAAFPNITSVGSAAFEFTATAAQAARTWVIVVGRVHLDDLDYEELQDQRYVTAHQEILAQYPWLGRLPAATVGDLMSNNGPLAGIKNHIEASDRTAIDNVPVVVDHGVLAAIMAESTASNDGVRKYGQPFSPTQLLPNGKYRFCWRSYCDYWSNPAFAPGGESNWYWSSTYSRVREGNFTNGTHLMSINRLGEAIITYQGAAGTGNPLGGVNFMQSADYRMALSLGIVISVQVITIRGSDNGSGWGPNPLQTPGTNLSGGSLLGLRITQPLTLNAVLNRPENGQGLPAPGTDLTYSISPATGFGIQPGIPSIVSMGQSAFYNHARFAVSGGYLTVPMYPLVPGTGLMVVNVPSNAIGGSVQWLAIPPAPDWSTTVLDSMWNGFGTSIEATDELAPVGIL